jgi:hypothetical protein
MLQSINDMVTHRLGIGLPCELICVGPQEACELEREVREHLQFIDRNAAVPAGMRIHGMEVRVRPWARLSVTSKEADETMMRIDRRNAEATAAKLRALNAPAEPPPPQTLEEVVDRLIEIGDSLNAGPFVWDAEKFVLNATFALKELRKDPKKQRAGAEINASDINAISRIRHILDGLAQFGVTLTAVAVSDWTLKGVARVGPVEIKHDAQMLSSRINMFSGDKCIGMTKINPPAAMKP